MNVIKPCINCGHPYDGEEADRINAPYEQLRADLKEANNRWHSACDVGRRTEARLNDRLQEVEVLGGQALCAIIRACAILARSFDSGSGHAGLGITHESALEASVAARTEYDQLRDALSASGAAHLRAVEERERAKMALAAVEAEREAAQRQLIALAESNRGDPIEHFRRLWEAEQRAHAATKLRGIEADRRVAELGKMLAAVEARRQ